MATSTDATDREIVLTREFAAPRGLVYRAWTDPDRIGRWWGPHGFTTTTSEFAQTAGGVWRFVMHGPDGTDYPNRVTFTAVVPNERLEYDHDADEHDGPEPFHVIVTFEDRPGGTLLTLRMRCVSAAACEHMKQFGAVEGGQQTLARLADELAGPKVGEAVVFTRTYAAPRPLVYQAWTDPAHVARWWGPRGFTNPVCEWDARPGGAINVHMTAPGGGPVFPMGGSFHEVVPGERLVFTTTALFDAAGVPQLETRTTVTFADRGATTEVVVRSEVVKATPAAAGALAGMEAGWGQSLDKLADELADQAG